jgi:phage head maturation protease
MALVPRSRGFRLERVKDLGSGAAPVGPNVYTFRANDGEFDRYQDRLSVAGWKLDAFNANPVILYNHDAGDGGWLGLGPKDTLPIGKGRAYVAGNALMVDIQFDQLDDFAKRVESKVSQGILNAVSVRYTIPDGAYTENEKGGLDSTAQELLEISIVTIPGNQRALRVKSADGVDPDAASDDALRASIDALTVAVKANTAAILADAAADQDDPEFPEYPNAPADPAPTAAASTVQGATHFKQVRDAAIRDVAARALQSLTEKR